MFRMKRKLEELNKSGKDKSRTCRNWENGQGSY